MGVEFAQLEVDLAPTAEFAEEEEEADPEEEAGVIGQPDRVARVGEVVEPVVEAGEEVADGAYQEGADPQGRPALRLRVWTWVLIRATANW